MATDQPNWSNAASSAVSLATSTYDAAVAFGEQALVAPLRGYLPEFCPNHDGGAVDRHGDAEGESPRRGRQLGHLVVCAPGALFEDGPSPSWCRRRRLSWAPTTMVLPSIATE